MTDAVKIDTADFGGNYAMYGILNAQGEFWTVQAFDTVAEAERHRDGFWAKMPDTLREIRRTHKIVPVRVILEVLNLEPEGAR